MNENCEVCGKINDTYCQSCTKCFKKSSGLEKNDDFPPHTKKCIDLNDLSFKEVCICEGLKQ